MKEATYTVFLVMLAVGLSMLVLMRRAAKKSPNGGTGLGPPTLLAGVLAVVGALGLLLAVLTW